MHQVVNIRQSVGYGAVRVEREPAPAAATPFFKVWLPGFLVIIACWLGIFGLNWWLAHSPGGGAVLGITAGIANIVALIVVVLLSGAIDRTDRYRFLMRTKLVLMVAFLLLLPAYVVGSGTLSMLVLAALSYLLILNGQSVYRAALETTVVDLAPVVWPSERTASLVFFHGEVARLIAPLIGGGLIAAGLLWSLPMLSALAVLVPGILLFLWSSLLTDEHRAEPAAISTLSRSEIRYMIRRSVDEAREAARWIKQQPVLVYMLIITVLINLVVFPFYTLLPSFLAELGLPHRTELRLYTYCSSAYGVGMLFTGGLLARFMKQSRWPIAQSSMTILAMIGVLGTMSYLHKPIALVIAMVVLGMLFVVLVAVIGGIWLDLTPSQMRVRIFSLRRLVSFASIPFGNVVMGFAGAIFGYHEFLRVLVIIVTVALCGAWICMRRALSGVGKPVEGPVVPNP